MPGSSPKEEGLLPSSFLVVRFNYVYLLAIMKIEDEWEKAL